MPNHDVQSLIDDPAIESVEIKLTVRADQEQLVHDALKKADVEPERRRIYFFDTDDLTLYESGLVVRARKIDGDTDNSTVKLRPVVPNDVDEKWKRLAEFTIELDAVGERMVCSAKLDADQSRGEIDEVLDGERKPEKLLSKDQEELLAAYAPAEIDWTGVRPLGPVEASKWEVEPEELGHELTVEMWVLPDGSDLVELSIKIEPDEAETAAADLRAFLTDRGLDIGGDQQTKTKAALSFFTGTAG